MQITGIQRLERYMRKWWQVITKERADIRKRKERDNSSCDRSDSAPNRGYQFPVVAGNMSGTFCAGTCTNMQSKSGLTVRGQADVNHVVNNSVCGTGF